MHISWAQGAAGSQSPPGRLSSAVIRSCGDDLSARLPCFRFVQDSTECSATLSDALRPAMIWTDAPCSIAPPHFLPYYPSRIALVDLGNSQPMRVDAVFSFRGLRAL
eukprot:m.50262 g.50262  ORF g.50262 m.50262 type:complete len:107 (+) comp9002_c0_seq1:552-872(+)